MVGTKWCTACKRRHPICVFGRDASRGDGLSVSCLASRRSGKPLGWHGSPNVNQMTGRPGPTPIPARDGDKKQARRRVNVLVRSGRLPHPNAIACADCGHTWKHGERRHDYDHHLGYDAEHHLDVEPVCTLCHRRRADDRGELNQERDALGRYRKGGVGSNG